MTVLIRPEGNLPADFNLSRRGLAGLTAASVFTGYAVAALAQDARPIVTDEVGLTTGMVTYPAPDGFDLPAYVARPEGDGPFPVVIVVSEIFGLHAYIMDVARRLAKAGYAAIAPAFFVRVEDPAPLSEMARIREIVNAAGNEQVMGDIAATLGLSRGHLVNDFYAAAAGVEALTAESVVTLQPGAPRTDAPRVVIGAGTGLGEALRVPAVVEGFSRLATPIVYRNAAEFAAFNRAELEKFRGVIAAAGIRPGD
jgi:hypothetical protein